MFFIVNKTKTNVFIKDLKLTLGPRQAIDLDKVMGREKSEDSKDLKNKNREGIIEVKRKDQISSYHIKEEPKIIDSKAELISEIREALKEVGNEIKQGIDKPAVGISKEDLMSAMKEVMASMPQASNTVIMQEVEKNINKDFDVQMDESLLADIHARAVNDLIKNSKTGYVNYKNEKVIGSVDNNVSELENLLG
ncbi:MAG: hypothetical protein J7L15_04045 [Clostridiales bacterium]|nr:hypothetical protein [Clostridiales bacterium]